MIPIMNSPSVSHVWLDERARALGCTDWYRRALVALWEVGIRTGVDPAVLAGQCALETGWGHFGGTVTVNYGNTCGMKNVDATGDTAADLAHFAIDRDGYPRLGALAHAHHLMLYAGHPIPLDSPDPRARYVAGNPDRFGKAPYVEDLSGLWAPSPDYGTNVARIVTRLIT